MAPEDNSGIMDKSKTGAADKGEAMEDLVAEVKRLRKRLYEIERLLTPVAREEIPEGHLTVLIARVGEERIALMHHNVEEIVPMARLTRMPETVPWGAGLLNLRGTMIAVIDVLARVQKRVRRQEVSDFIIVCRVNSRLVGLVVQEVLDIQIANSNDVQPPPKDVPFAPHLLGTLETEEWPALLVSVATLVETSDLPGVGT